MKEKEERNRMTKFAKIFVDYYLEEPSKSALYALKALDEDDVEEAAGYIHNEFVARGFGFDDLPLSEVSEL